MGSDRLLRWARRVWRAPSTTVYNERVMYAETLFTATSSAGAMSFISVFLVRLGAPSWLVGLYTSLPALVMILTVLPMGSFVQRQRSLVATLNWSRFVFRTIVGSFALLPWLPLTIAPYVLVGARCLVAIPGAALNVAGTTLMGQITTPNRRPRMLSTRSAIMGIFAAAVGFLAGQWLDFAPYPLNYQLLFASAFLAGLGSVYVLSRLRLPETSPEVSEPAIRPRKRIGLSEVLPLIKSAPAFRNFTIAAFVFRLGMSLPVALFPIYRVRTLGSSDAWIGILFTVQRLLSVLTYFALGRLASRRKYRRWLWVACPFMALFPLTTALATTPQMLLIPAAIGGIFSPGVNIFLTNTLFQVSPEDQRPSFVAANSFLSSVTRFAAPLLGTALAGATSMQLAMIIASGLRIVGGFVFWRLGVGSERRT